MRLVSINEYMVLLDGRRYEIVPVPEGAIPDHIIEESYPGWMFVASASTKAEAELKIKRDIARRKPDTR